MLIKDIFTPNVACCGPQISAARGGSPDAPRARRRSVVVDDPREERRPARRSSPTGTSSSRSLGNGLDPAKTTVGSLMRKPVVIAYETEDTVQLIERMRAHGVRRVPVVANEGEVVGIVTLDDLLRILVTDASACSRS